MKPAADLRNSRGQPLRVIESPGDDQKVAVFYPGMGYGPMAPLFFEASSALSSRGWTVVAVDYRYNENAEFLAASDGEKEAWFAADSLDVGRWAAEWFTGVRQTACVAKSLGTTMLLNQVKAGLVPAETALVWLTPPGNTAAEQFAILPTLSHRSLVAYGTADPNFLRAATARPKPAPRLSLVEVPGAGHSFEVTGDHRRSLNNIADVVDAVLTFLGETP